MIIHYVKDRKEDGTEVELIPLRDIEVTAPGYSYSGDDNRLHLFKAGQNEQLLEAFKQVCPAYADHWECVDSDVSKNGGTAKFRIYIEEPNLPKLRESVRQSMVFGKPRIVLFGDRKLNYEHPNAGNYNKTYRISSNTERLLDTGGYLIKNGNCPINRPPSQRAFFYYANEGAWSFPFMFLDKTTAEVFDAHNHSVDEMINLLENDRHKEGLVDIIRAELFKEMIGKENE